MLHPYALDSVDYTAIGMMLVFSANTGGYLWYMKEYKNTMDSYVMLDRKASLISVGFSLMACYMSSAIIIGLPAEIYRFGTHLAFSAIGYFIGALLSMSLFFSVLHHHQGTTIYKYLEVRFGKWSRVATAGAFLIQVILYLTVAMSSCATTLGVVSGLPRWVFILCVGTSSIFYSSLGGMKSLHWTAIFHSLVMYITLLIVIFEGSNSAGGMEHVVDVAREGGRLQIPATDETIPVRYTFWNVFIGAIIHTFAIYGSGQIHLQRISVFKHILQWNQAAFLGSVLYTVFYILCCIAGIVVYANFASCDPVHEEQAITSADQMLAYFVVTMLNEFPGVQGLCLSGILGAMLSSAASIIHASATVTTEDLLKVLHKDPQQIEKREVGLTKLLTLLYGVICMLLAYFYESSSGVLETSVSLTSICAGPVLGVFFLGMFTMNSNEKGTVTGLLVGMTTVAAIYFTSLSLGSITPELPMETYGCSSSVLNATQAPHLDHVVKQAVRVIHSNKLSYLWYLPIGCLATVISGYVISLLTGYIRHEKPQTTEVMLSPVIRFCFAPLLKESARRV